MIPIAKEKLLAVTPKPHAAYIAVTSAGQQILFTVAPGKAKPVRKNYHVITYLAGPAYGETKKAAKEAVRAKQAEANRNQSLWALNSPTLEKGRVAGIVYSPSLNAPGRVGKEPEPLPIDPELVEMELDF